MAITYELGATLGGIATLSSLNIPDPESNFTEYPVRRTLGNGLVRGYGNPTAEWHYGFLTAAQYDALRAFCAGAGAAVFISTMTNDRDFVTYSANMELPERYINRVRAYTDITIKFTNLIAQ